MLFKQSVLPNFVRTAALLAITCFSFSANANHHENDMKKAKSEHMQKSADEMHAGGMKDKIGKKHKDIESDLDHSSLDLEAQEDALETATDEDQPERN